MNKLYKYLGAVLMMSAVTLTSCSPEDFAKLNEANIPLASEMADAVDIQVNQETNEVTFNLNSKGYMPYWYFKGQKQTPYSTINGFKRIYTVAGDYSVDVRIMNANGISDGMITKSFTINNTIFDFDKYEKYLAGDSAKEWYIARNIEGYLGYGAPDTDGLGWWSAKPNEQAALGIYDDVVTFTADKSYTYNPGEGGTMYVNKDCTHFEEFRGDAAADFMVQVNEQVASWTLEVSGADLFLVFPQHTQFPYIANDSFWENPRMKVLSMNSKKMELLYDNGSIAWHYILTTEKEEVFNGFKYDSEFNLWKNASFDTPAFYYAPGWSQIGDPEFTQEGATYTLNFPTATYEQWQAQVLMGTNIATSSSKQYDFSVILNSSTAHQNVTVKLTEASDDNVFYFTEKVSLKAGEDYILYKSAMQGIDMNKVKLVMDFGGNAENTIITFSNVVFKDHANDDGTKLPEEQPEVDNIQWNEDAPSNLWKTATIETGTFYADANWTPYPETPALEASEFDYTIELPSATVQQWQAQILFHTNIQVVENNLYDFRCALTSNNDLRNVTVKLVQTDEGGNDNSGNFFFIKNIDLNADETFVLKMPAAVAPCNMNAVTLVLDFGGNPENTEIVLSKVIVQNHK